MPSSASVRAQYTRYRRLRALAKMGHGQCSLPTPSEEERAERQAIRQYGLSVFVLQSSWSSRRYWEKLSQLVLWCPRIVEQANAVERAALEVPWRISTRFRQL